MREFRWILTAVAMVVVGSGAMPNHLSAESRAVTPTFSEYPNLPLDALGSWDETFFLPGLQAPGREMTVHKGQVVVSGYFNAAGDANVPRLARWTGKRWLPFNQEDIGFVTGMVSHAGKLYVCGQLSDEGATRRRVVYWDDNAWVSLPDPIVIPEALFSFDGALFCGGAGGVSRWNGSEWMLLTMGSAKKRKISSFTAHQDHLVAAGWGYIGLLDGGGFTPIAEDFPGAILALATHRGKLIVGGTFSGLAGEGNSRIAAWDGDSWFSLGQGVWGGWPNEGEVTALAAKGEYLYAAGAFTEAGGQSIHKIARWNGRTWSSLGQSAPFGEGFQSTLNGHPYVHALAVQGNELFVTGAFTRAGNIAAPYIAAWDGKQWNAVSPPGAQGLTGPVQAIIEYEGDLIVGGSFTEAGPIQANHIARWDGSEWHALGAGLDNVVMAMTVYQGKLVAAGYFHSAGGAPAERIAIWDGESWSSLGGGMNLVVLTVEVHRDTLIAGGYFNRADGKYINHVAAWYDGEWNDMRWGVRGGSPYVTTLHSDGVTLFAGGSFKYAGSGGNARNIARWDGSDWHSVGSGVDGVVTDIDEFDGRLVISGRYSLPGDATEYTLATWDGVDWIPLPTQPAGGAYGPVVFSLYTKGELLLAGGVFDSVGGLSCTNMAGWDGSSWRATEAAFGHIRGFGAWSFPVNAFGYHGEDLYVAGEFTRVGGLHSSFLGRFHPASESGARKAESPSVILRVGPNPSAEVIHVDLQHDPIDRIDVRVFDILGRVVGELYSGEGTRGEMSLVWNGRDSRGVRLPAGVYFLRVATPKGVESRRLVLLQ